MGLGKPEPEPEPLTYRAGSYDSDEWRDWRDRSSWDEDRVPPPYGRTTKWVPAHRREAMNAPSSYKMPTIRSTYAFRSLDDAIASMPALAGAMYVLRGLALREYRKRGEAGVLNLINCIAPKLSVDELLEGGEE